MAEVHHQRWRIFPRDEHSINFPLGLLEPLLSPAPKLKPCGSRPRVYLITSNLTEKKGWKYSVVELDGNEKLAWMPSGNKQPWLTWPVMRYSIRRRMRQLHFLPLLNRTAKIFWIQMLPSHTGNVIRGRSLTGWWSFSIKFLPTKPAVPYRNAEPCQLKWFENFDLYPMERTFFAL